jgi:hypothetical protein
VASSFACKQGRRQGRARAPASRALQPGGLPTRGGLGGAAFCQARWHGGLSGEAAWRPALASHPRGFPVASPLAAAWAARRPRRRCGLAGEAARRLGGRCESWGGAMRVQRTGLAPSPACLVQTPFLLPAGGPK